MLAEAGAGVVHGEDDAENGEIWILTTLFNALHQIENFTNPFQSEVFALDGDENFFGGDEGAGHEQADAGRAVENDEIEGGIEAEGIEGLANVEEGVVHACEIHFGPGEVEFGGKNLEVRVAGGLEQVEGAGLPQEDGVETFSGHVLQAQAAGGVGLRIEINEEDATAREGGAGGEVDGGGGFPDASLLIDNGNDAHNQGKRRKRFLSSGFPEWFT